MAGVTLSEALAAFGRTAHGPPKAPVVHGSAGTLVTFGLPNTATGFDFVGVWVDARGVRFLGPVPDPTGGAEAHGLTGPSAALFELFVGASRVFLERVEEVDSRLAEAQERGRSVSLNEVWSLQRRVAHLRAQLGRALVGLAELSGRLSSNFPGFAGSQPAVVGELERVQSLAANVQQSLSDLILLRNAEESNRIAEVANELGRVSNTIAAFANTSNIRMLGLTYIALILGLVSAAVLIPNTAATVLGMPSAAWVPGVWVDVILGLLIVAPVIVIFSRRWVRTILRGLIGFEDRAEEGIRDLPEVRVEPPRRPPAAR